MVKRISALILTLVLLFSFAGCDRNEMSKMDIDPKITMEEVNDSSAQVVRAFFESLFYGNREMFEKCFPQSFLDEVSEDGIDLYEQYSQSLEMPGEFAGSQYINYNELDSDSGYDDSEVFRENISDVQGIDVSKIESMQIVCIKLYFTTEEENQYLELYSIAYKTEGKWYMYQIQDSDAEFGKE